MPEGPVTLVSKGLELAGNLHLPEGLEPADRLPAVILLHGFGGTKDAPSYPLACRRLNDAGYAALRFDFRGCGESAGRPGYVILSEEVEDAVSAVSFLSGHPKVDPSRIGVLGSSLGAPVAILAGVADRRIRAVISSNGIGSGRRFGRRLRAATPGAWEQYVRRIEEDRERRRLGGDSVYTSRFDIVPIPLELRHQIAAMASRMEFPLATAESLVDLDVESVVDRLSPTPLLLLHSLTDSVVDAEESQALYDRAKEPKSLVLLEGADHFLFLDKPEEGLRVVLDWLSANLRRDL